MRRPIHFLAMIIGSLALVACASAPVITSNYDHKTDFSTYRTFGYIEPLGTDVAGYQSLVTQTMKDATRQELESRGYTYAATGADLLINFNAKLTQQTQFTQAPASPPMYYGYRRGFYSGWGGYGYDTQVTQYTEGTLNVDIVDAARKQLVWEGVAVGRVTEKQTQDRVTAINSAVKDMFAKYPFRAGN